jgi:hypothetical protein
VCRDQLAWSSNTARYVQRLPHEPLQFLVALWWRLTVVGFGALESRIMLCAIKKLDAEACRLSSCIYLWRPGGSSPSSELVRQGLR